MNSNRTRCRIACCAAALGLVLWSGATRIARGEPTTHTVIMDVSRYMPDVLNLKVGDTVEWINKDLVPHTATSKMGGFDSGAIEPGKSWKYTLKRAGDFEYSCTFHPNMKAMLHVG